MIHHPLSFQFLKADPDPDGRYLDPSLTAAPQPTSPGDHSCGVEGFFACNSALDAIHACRSQSPRISRAHVEMPFR